MPQRARELRRRRAQGDAGGLFSLFAPRCSMLMTMRPPMAIESRYRPTPAARVKPDYRPAAPGQAAIRLDSLGPRRVMMRLDGARRICHDAPRAFHGDIYITPIDAFMAWVIADRMNFSCAPCSGRMALQPRRGHGAGCFVRARARSARRCRRACGRVYLRPASSRFATQHSRSRRGDEAPGYIGWPAKRRSRRRLGTGRCR